MLNLNPNVNFLLNMNNMPGITHPPNMVPAGSLNIPLFEETPASRLDEEARRNRFKPLLEMEKPYKPSYVPEAPLPPISVSKLYEPPVYTPKSYEPPALSYIPPKLEILPLRPIKNFWDKTDKY